MSKVLEYLQIAVNGFVEFIVEYKLLPLVIGVLLYAAIRRKKGEKDKARYFWIYAAVVMILLLVPVTAAIFLVYQTRFYDYGWAWSVVPLTAVLAWGIVTVVYEELPGTEDECRESPEVSSGMREEQREAVDAHKEPLEVTADMCGEQRKAVDARKIPPEANADMRGELSETGTTADPCKDIRESGKRKIVLLRFAGFAAAVLVLWICGNQGQLQQVPEEELAQQAVAEAILQYLEDEGTKEAPMIWGPKVMMQYLRSHSGEITLFYGRDMWDLKAGAYDYESYTAEENACYEWMELLSSSHNLFLLEINQAPEQIHEALADGTQLETAIGSGVDFIILPSQITPWVERKIEKAAESKGLDLSAVQVAEYTLWMLEQ